jgi:hypothetical protein
MAETEPVAPVGRARVGAIAGTAIVAALALAGAVLFGLSRRVMYLNDWFLWGYSPSRPSRTWPPRTRSCVVSRRTRWVG